MTRAPGGCHEDFYAGLGWRLDADFAGADGSRGIQFTPPGSGCSVQFGTDVTTAEPGSAQGLHLIVSDIEAARDDLVAHGAQPTEVYHCAAGYGCRVPRPRGGPGERPLPQ